MAYENTAVRNAYSSNVRSNTNHVNTANRPGRVISYPAADDQTAAFVTKLQMRGGMNLSHIGHTTASERLQNAYESSSYRTVQTAGMPAAQTSQNAQPQRQAPVTNEKYSPYSNINMAARQEQRSRESEADMRRMVRPEVINRTNGGASKPANAVKRQKPDAVRGKTPNASNVAAARKRIGGAKSYASANRAMSAKSERGSSIQAVRTKEKALSRSSRTDAAVLESGPREVAFKRVPFPKFAVMVVALCLIFFFMINSMLQNYQYKRELAEIQDEYDTLSSYAAELELSLEDRYDMNYIEEAAAELGMVKSSQVEEKYISLELSDVIEIYNSEDSELDGSATTLLSSLSRQLSKFFSN
ncbi:MAG: septum formation initiator family protein [Firmicutes bacterium]|nr:septum formation initiator family protein [Bacillota bacterium]